MSAAPEPARPVWLTREQRDAIENMLAHFYEMNRTDEIVAAWDAAPADPQGAATHEIVEYFFPQCTPDECDEIVSNVLRALGWTRERLTPDPEQA